MKPGTEIRPWLPAEDETLRQMWMSGRSVDEIAGQLKRNRRNVYVRRWHLQLPTVHELMSARLNDPAFREQFRQLYVSGATYSQIRDQLGTDTFHIVKLAGQLGLPRRRDGSQSRGRRRHNPRKYSDEIVNEIAKRRAAGEDIQTIASALKLTYDAVGSICTRYRLIDGMRRFWTVADDRQLRELVGKELPPDQIGTTMRRTLCSIRARCDRLGINSGAIISIPTQRKRTLTIRQALKYKLSAVQARRTYSCSVDLELLLRLYDQQCGRCYYTGLTLAGGTCDPNTVSIDRVDSTRGYEPNNVVLCIWEVNRMKQSLPKERFLELCRMVSHHSKGAVSSSAGLAA